MFPYHRVTFVRIIIHSNMKHTNNLKELLDDKESLICNIKTLNDCIEVLSFQKEDISLINEIAHINSLFIDALVNNIDKK